MASTFRSDASVLEQRLPESLHDQALQRGRLTYDKVGEGTGHFRIAVNDEFPRLQLGSNQLGAGK